MPAPDTNDTVEALVGSLRQRFWFDGRASADPGHHWPLAATADRLAATLASDDATDDFQRVQSLLDELGADSRLIAFFSSGVVSFANQSVAQFAGWNIPGVGEGDQKFRPRTRLYDTPDPDTIAQVCASLDYNRTSIVFLVGPGDAAAQSAWAEALIPEFQARLGDDAGQRIAFVGGARGRTDDATASALATRVGDAGGRVLGVGDAGPHALSPLGLAVGMARAVDPHRVRAGARAHAQSVAAADRDAASALNARATASSITVVPLSDRLGRFAAWAAAHWNVNRSGTGVPFAEAASQCWLGQPAAIAGFGPMAGRSGAWVDLCALAPADAARSLAPELERASAAFAADVARFGASGRATLLTDDSPEQFGALVVHVLLETEATNAAIA